MLVDSHCHLDFDEFATDLDRVMQRAAEAGIETLLTISIRVREFARIQAVVDRYSNVYGSVGTHPHYADEEREVTTRQLVRLAGHPKVVAIGETGLDTWLGNASWEAQLECFHSHIGASRETGLPLVIHSVRQDEAMGSILKEESAKGAFPVVMHCFSGGRNSRRSIFRWGITSRFPAWSPIPSMTGCVRLPGLFLPTGCWSRRTRRRWRRCRTRTSVTSRRIFIASSACWRSCVESIARISSVRPPKTSIVPSRRCPTPAHRIP